MKKIEPYKGIASIYEDIRPSYPEKLLQDIISRVDLKPNDSLLEIGAGTGKATIQFAQKGYRVHAVELGQDMADILKDKCAKYPKVSVDVAAFEEWSSSTNQKFDMIYCAQAFHWIDKNVKYERCHELLKDNGFLVLFWYNPCSDKLPATKQIEQKVEKIIEKYVSQYSPDKQKPQRRMHDGVANQDERAAEIDASGLFKLIEKIEYTQETRNNPTQYLKVMKSVPAFASILDGLDDKVIENMDNEIQELINNDGGYVGSLFNFSLYIAKKI